MLARCVKERSWADGVDARIIRPSHGLPSVDEWSPVGIQRRAHPRTIVSNERRRVVQIKPLSVFGTLVLAQFSERAAR